MAWVGPAVPLSLGPLPSPEGTHGPKRVNKHLFFLIVSGVRDLAHWGRVGA